MKVDTQTWRELADVFSKLRQRNAASKLDIPGSEYDTALTLTHIAERSRRFEECETRIRQALDSKSALTWYVKRYVVGKRCRQVHLWFDRSTDDNFDWTRQDSAIRTARDELDRILLLLGF